MKHSIGLVVLSSALVLFSRLVIASSSTISTISSGTTLSGCVIEYVSDGDCDDDNNTEECGYDGGDCCKCTCVNTADHTCGDHGFSCLDPDALCFDDDDDVTSLPTIDDCIPDYASDGDCDLGNNIEECGYDGGDCCECTCVSAGDFTCGDPARGGFECIDPSAPCHDDDDDDNLSASFSFDDMSASYSYDTLGGGRSSCREDLIGDGDCDTGNNIEECGYDGGDCCECTCVSAWDFTCGDPSRGGFECIDPSAPCSDDDNDNLSASFSFGDTSASDLDDTLGGGRSSCREDSIGDGDCDMANNIEECGYDDGDCCECTCADTADHTCGDHGFSCLDSDALCFDDDDDITSLPAFEDCIPDYASDGDCDLGNNIEECGYDGGDCCECTCVSDGKFTCGDPSRGGFECIDPSAPCSDDGDDNLSASFAFDDMSANDSYNILGGGRSPCREEFIGDGDCDPRNNIEECDYDGGDCCECDCLDTLDHLCGLYTAFDCIDPTSSCFIDQVLALILATEGEDEPGEEGRGGA